MKQHFLTNLALGSLVFGLVTAVQAEPDSAVVDSGPLLINSILTAIVKSAAKNPSWNANYLFISMRLIPIQITTYRHANTSNISVTRLIPR